MRSVWCKVLLLLACATAIHAQVNPHTQIRWPASCRTTGGQTYNWVNNECVDINDIDPNTQVTWPTSCNAPGAVYDATAGECPNNINQIHPGNQVLWPSSCTSGTVYNPSSNTCVAMGTGSNPGGTNMQVQYNNAGFLGGATGVNFDGNGGLAATGTLAASTTIASAPPMLDIRHSAFSGGAICDNTTAHPIDSALQAAINALPTTGGQISIVGNPLACYLANPPAISWTGHGNVTVNIQGNLTTGTTLTVPQGVQTNIQGQSAGQSSVQFASPGTTALINVSPTGGGTGSLGTAITATYTGAGDPTASTPAACGSSIAGAIYRDTGATNSIYWTCAITSGSITSGTNSLTVTNAGGFTVGNSITVAGAGASGGTLSTFITAISGTAFTLNASAGTTVSGAAVTATANSQTGVISTSVKFGWVPGAVLTFTPSSMSGLVAGAAITVSQACSATINTISRASSFVNTANVTFPAGCEIPAGVVANVAGVTDASFNGTHTTGGAAGSYIVQSSDYTTNTMLWKGNSNTVASSAGGTVTGMNEYNIEDVYISSCGASTCTATFFRPHASTDMWGVVGVTIGTNAQTSYFRDFSIIAPGNALWLPQAYETRIINVSSANTHGCGTNPATSVFSYGVDTGITNWMHFENVAFTSTCEPYSINQGQAFNAGYASNGPIYMENSFILPGIKQGFGGEGVFMRNSVCDQCARGIVTYDSTVPYWNANPNFARFDNVWTQDNPNGLSLCYVYQTSALGVGSGANGAPLVETAKIAGTTGCIVNDYFTGSLKSDAGQYGLNTRLGVVGPRNDGKTLEGELRGEQAGFGPELIPTSTVNINQTGSSWTVGTCTKTTGVLGPDGTTSAVSLSGANYPFATMGAWNGTPAVGDMILFGGWVYSETAGTKAVVTGTGSAYSVDNNNSTHFKLGGLTSTYTGVGAAQYDSSIVNDWWHPVVGFTTVTASDGTAGQFVDLVGGCGTNTTLDYFKPFLIYIPASSGITQAEVLRWRAQLAHGIVPPNMPSGGGILAMDASHKLYWGSDTDLYRSAAGVVKTDGTINAVAGYQVNGSALATSNLADWTNSAATTSSFAKCATVLGGVCTAWAPATPSGGGNVSGPGSSTNGDCASFNGATGTILQDSGIPCTGLVGVVASVDQTAQVANITGTAAYAVPVAGAGWYRVQCYVVLTTAATTSSTLPSCFVQWTDKDAGVTAKTTTGGSTLGISGTSTQNVVGTTGIQTALPFNSVSVHAAASSNIVYGTTGYVSAGATAMQYAVHVKVENLGP